MEFFKSIMGNSFVPWGMKKVICNSYFPIFGRQKNKGFLAALELVRRGKRKIINFGMYRLIGLYIETISKE